MKGKMILVMISLALSLNLFASVRKIVGIEGMVCDACVSAISKNVSKLDGVAEVKVLLNQKKAFITLKGDATLTQEQVANALKTAGEQYKVSSFK